MPQVSVSRKGGCGACSLIECSSPHCTTRNGVQLVKPGLKAETCKSRLVIHPGPMKSGAAAEILIRGILSAWILAAHADERLWMQAEINGEPVRLCFDSGASDLFLLGGTARRLGLTVTGPPTNVVLYPGAVPTGTTEECLFKLQSASVKTRFQVFDLPPYLEAGMDGVVGWGPLRRNRFQVDAEARTVTWLANLPKAALTWTKLRVVRRSACLELELPRSNGKSGTIFVDTGDSKGVGLNPQDWHEWRLLHSNRPITLTSFFTPGAGLLVKEEAWANKLSLGPVMLTQVPVTEAIPLVLTIPHFRASFGLAALKRLDFVVDGRRGVVYLRPKHATAPAYQHNRLGAVFVPADPQSNDLTAQVVDGGPAQEAGIRAGDVLLKIDEVDATKWRTDPTVLPLTRFWARPAGTKLDLSLRREGETFKATPTLRDILSPDLGEFKP